MPTRTLFSARKVSKLRRRAGDAATFPESLPQGWSKSPVDPMEVLAVFKPLRIREGYTLCAYQFYDGGNGNGFVWAVPTDIELPSPEECTAAQTAGLFAAPKPAGALDDVMEAIEGNGTPLSFLCASIFAREMAEFGAIWHGCNWSTHKVLDKDKVGSTQAPYWEWQEPFPEEWKPAVTESEHEVQVEFITQSALGQETIYRFVDTYRPPSYTFTSKESPIAYGQAGFVF